jgi:hypothetical protein
VASANHTIRQVQQQALLVANNHATVQFELDACKHQLEFGNVYRTLYHPLLRETLPHHNDGDNEDIAWEQLWIHLTVAGHPQSPLQGDIPLPVNPRALSPPAQFARNEEEGEIVDSAD